MLLSKLRVVFENAGAELELWSKAGSGQIEMQLRERRRGFARRRDSLERVQSAAGELELRIAEVQQQEDHLVHLISRIEVLAANAVAAARCPPGEEGQLVDAVAPGAALPGPATVPVAATQSRRGDATPDGAAPASLSARHFAAALELDDDPPGSRQDAA
jgi:hypothetical protein